MFMRTTDFHPQPVIDLGALAVLVLAVVLSASRRVALGEMRDARCETKKGIRWIKPAFMMSSLGAEMFGVSLTVNP